MIFALHAELHSVFVCKMFWFAKKSQRLHLWNYINAGVLSSVFGPKPPLKLGPNPLYSSLLPLFSSGPHGQFNWAKPTNSMMPPLFLSLASGPHPSELSSSLPHLPFPHRAASAAPPLPRAPPPVSSFASVSPHQRHQASPRPSDSRCTVSRFPTPKSASDSLPFLPCFAGAEIGRWDSPNPPSSLHAS